MKNLKCILLVIFVSLAAKMQGDVIVIEPNKASIGVRISNPDDFPDITVIGYRDGVALSKSEKAFIVDSNTYFEGDEKSPLTFYVVKSDYLKKKKLNKIDLQKDKNVQKLNLIVLANTFNTYDYTSVEIDYTLVCNKDNIYYLYNSETTYRYQKELVKYPERRGNRPETFVKNRTDYVVDPFESITVTAKPVD